MLTIYEVNLTLENYSQKILLKFYNKNLKKYNKTPRDLPTMQKYLNKLEKEINVIAKFYFKKNPKSIIYYKINCSLERVFLKIKDYFVLFYE
ncbi:plasmid maintenance protein (plasmid) [Borreliella americana]